MALPGVHRLKGRRAFDHLYRRGRSLHGTLLVLRLVESQPGLLAAELRHRSPSPWRAAVVVSAKVSKRAVVRNRLRRRLHELLRQQLAPVAGSAPLWLLLSLRPGSAEAGADALLGECSTLLHKAGLLP